MMRSRTAWSAAALLCLSAGALANVAGVGVNALDDFAHDNPRAGLYMTGQRVTSVYGPAFSHGDSAADSISAFLARHAGLFGVTPAELTVGAAERDMNGPIGVMPDGEGGFKFTLFNFRHEYAGLPVFRSELKLLVRNEADFPLVLARSSLRSVQGFVVDRDALDRPAVALARAVAQTRFPVLTDFTEPEAVIFAGDDNAEAPPRLAIRFMGTGGDPRLATYDAQLIISDAATGELLHAEPMIHNIDMAGTVSGLATDGGGADFCHPEVARGLPYARITIGATTAFADVNGDYLVPNVAGGTLTVTASIAQGQHFRISGASTISQNIAAPGPANFLFNPSNTEAGNAQVNAYLHANIIRDWALLHSPGYPVNVTNGMNINVNVGSTCNATYDPTLQQMNFYASGGGCPNTGFSSVVYHEYGHHLVNRAGSGQGQYGEGMGDCMSVLILDDPVLGRGWSGSCSSGLRNAVNTMQYPCSGAIHTCGTLISGAVWDTRNALLATHPATYRQILSELVVNSILLHTGNLITPQITIDLITLDDDDSDISNGSPHYNQVNQGFTLHNMAAPPLSALVFAYPDGLPTQVHPSGETFQVRIAGTGANVPSQNGAVLYVDTDGDNVFEQYPMQFVSAGANGNTYNATFPSADCAANIRYYVSGNTTTNLTIFNPTSAPNAAYSAVAATDIELTFDDDFETNQGWTVGAPGDNATSGIWVRVDPVGTAAQPENDFDADGTMCYVTGQGVPGGGLGDNDVDGGSTTLTSPAMDASVGAAAYVSYARWYSNNTGGAPNADTFIIDISDDNGATWTRLETVGPAGPETAGGWFFKRFNVEDFVDRTSTVRLRFIASDLGTGSLVEAAVDAVTIETYDCLITCLGDLNGDLVVDFADLNVLLGNYGGTGAGDLNGDGDVDFDDLNTLLGFYGQPC
ncbi:MAG: hypothetical protein IBJ10_02960 [Phycisphaerales bacterium]|nr:hypothetical protein [Phycisphaerales bacterium]